MAYVMTVLGPVDAEQVGVTLMHEHVFCDTTARFAPVDDEALKRFEYAPVNISILSRLRRRPFDICRDNLVLSDESMAIDELMAFVREGGTTLVDCTLPGIGRNPSALRRVAQATGLNIVQGTGAYVESTHPEWVEAESVDQLAARFAAELTMGIGDSGVCAGIIGEIGASGIPNGLRTRTSDLTSSEEKVLRAAGRASLATGASVCVHLDPRGKGAFVVTDVLFSEGVAPDRMIMCHMDANPDLEYHLEIAQRGVYLEYDHFGREYYAGHMNMPYTADSRRIELLTALLKAGHEKQLLLSQDICAKIDLCAFGGVGYAHIVGELLPAFRRAGITDTQIDLMLRLNPRKALAFESAEIGVS